MVDGGLCGGAGLAEKCKGYGGDFVLGGEMVFWGVVFVDVVALFCVCWVFLDVLLLLWGVLSICFSCVSN